MPITVTCPRCKQSMAAASKLAGSYVTCPRCSGRFWVPENVGDEPSGSAVLPPGSAAPGAPSGNPSDSTRPGPPHASAPPAVQPLPNLSSGSLTKPIPRAPPPPGSRAKRAPASGRPGATSDTVAVPAAGLPAQTPPSGKKVARFITAEAAQSTLDLAENGKLPGLRLEETTYANTKQEKGLTVNPLVLLGLICLSIVSSVFLVLYEPERQTPSHSARKDRARLDIAGDYFANFDSPGAQEPYQVLLREAQRAYARRDYETERRLYRRVLALLRAEGSEFEGVTGSPARDKKLEELIIILLRDGTD